VALNNLEEWNARLWYSSKRQMLCSLLYTGLQALGSSQSVIHQFSCSPCQHSPATLFSRAEDAAA